MTSPRWQPDSEVGILAAINQQTLPEGHHFDGKRQIGDSPSARKETARDLASFAIDGGWLLIGIEETKEPPGWRIEPQELRGLGERIEQVARSVCEPPLFVLTRSIPSDQDPDSRGYLVVDVPPSPLAPHMVDGRYYGRGDKTKHTLSDAEVLRHHQTRASLESQIDTMLDAEIARDPAGRGDQVSGRLYAVAQPMTAPRHLARDLVRDQTQAPYQLIQNSDGRLPKDLAQIPPGIDYLTAGASPFKRLGEKQLRHERDRKKPASAQGR